MKRPVLYCTISFCIGIALANISIPVLYPVSFCFISIVLAAILFKNNILSHVFLYLALIFFGAAYCQSYNILPANHIANFATEEKTKVMLKGIITDDPVTGEALYGKKRTAFTVQAQGLGKMGQSPLFCFAKQSAGTVPIFPVTGLVRVNIYSDEEMKDIDFGDEVIIEGNLSRPKGLKNPGLFDYSNYLKIKNIYAVLTVNGSDSIRKFRDSPHNEPLACLGTVPIWDGAQKAAYKLRRGINDAITRYTDSRYSGFLKAILTGERSGLEVSVTDDFVKTGTVHVIAISGLNIALIAGIFIFIFKVFGIKKKFNLLLTSVFLFFYCFVAGANPPVVRATIMFAIVCLGYLINRESDILNSLAIAAFIILLGNPNELFDPSFQLSFASIFGIVLFSPRIENLFSPKPNYFIKGAALSIAAIIAVSPIVGRYFNIVSPAAVIANLVIVPALFVITVASFIFLFLNLLGLKFILVYVGYALSSLTQVTFYINHIFAQIPLSYIRIPSPSFSFLLAYYAFIFSFFFLRRKKELFMILLLTLNLAVWGRIFAAQDKELKVTFLDVGMGDSVLIEFPNDTTMLIDAGSGGIEGFADIGRSVVAPYLWNKGIRRIDAVIGTHFHEDHMGGLLYILKNFDTGCVMDGGMSSGSNAHLYDSYRKIILQRNMRRLSIADGDEILKFGDIRLFVINPPQEIAEWDANNSSVVIKLEYKDFSMLFCGDASDKAMENMLKYSSFLKSDVLKVPHHGGSTGKEATAKMFFEEVSPKVSIISSAADLYLKDLSQENLYPRSVIYSTRKNGAIEIITNGTAFTIRPFCQ